MLEPLRATLDNFGTKGASAALGSNAQRALPKAPKSMPKWRSGFAEKHDSFTSYGAWPKTCIISWPTRKSHRAYMARSQFRPKVEE